MNSKSIFLELKPHALPIHGINSQPLRQKHHLAINGLKKKFLLRNIFITLLKCIATYITGITQHLVEAENISQFSTL